MTTTDVPPLQVTPQSYSRQADRINTQPDLAGKTDDLLPGGLFQMRYFVAPH